MRLAVGSLVPLLSLTLAACAFGKPLYAKERFELSEVQGASIALLPVVDAVFDEDTTATVGQEYGTIESFLRTLSSQVSASVAKGRQAPVIGAEATRAMLSASPEAASLLEPRGVVLDPAFPGARPASASAVAAAAGVEGLKGVRFLVVLRRVILTRGWVTGAALPAFPAAGPRPPVGSAAATAAASANVPAASSQEMRTTAGLEWAVLDLKAGEVVWADRATSTTTSLFMKVTALHEVEYGLASTLGRALKPPPPPPMEP